LKRLVDEFSRFGKMPEIHKSPTALVSVVDEIATLYKGYKEIEVDISKPENDMVVKIDKEQIRRVLINIFDNAVQAMTNNGKITVKINFNSSANNAQIEIADNGPGIKDEDKERLFQPYFSTRKNGTGLGLAIADRIITEHGGHIRVRDNQPNGTVFSIEIPIKEL
jgi:two-component system nitrogen regulation sensor histidine kinase NtrY